MAIILYTVLYIAVQLRRIFIADELGEISRGVTQIICVQFYIFETGYIFNSVIHVYITM